MTTSRSLAGSVLLLVVSSSAFTALPSAFSSSSRPTLAIGGVQAASIESETATATISTTRTEEEVIAAAKKFMKSTGYFDPLDESLMADDFIFRGPVIGPLNKKDYIEVLDYFGMHKAFPDLDNNCFGFSIDPDDPLRVWFFMRATGTYQKPLGGPVGTILQPEGQKYRGSTESWSLTLNEDLKVRLINAGYVADRFDPSATTDGRGLSFGILSSLGLPLPSSSGDPRLRLVQGITSLLVGTGLVPKAVSPPEDVPMWWRSEKRGADP